MLFNLEDLGTEPPNEENDYRGDNPCDSKAIEAEFGDIREEDRETHYYETGLDIEFCPDCGAEPVGHTDGVGNEKTDNECAESPLEIAVESVFGADEPYEECKCEEHDECGDKFLYLLSLELDSESEKTTEDDDGNKGLAPESPGCELLPERDNLGCSSLREVFAHGPCAELERRKVEPAGQDRDNGDDDDRKSDPY